MQESKALPHFANGDLGNGTWRSFLFILCKQSSKLLKSTYCSFNGSDHFNSTSKSNRQALWSLSNRCNVCSSSGPSQHLKQSFELLVTDLQLRAQCTAMMLRNSLQLDSECCNCSWVPSGNKIKYLLCKETVMRKMTHYLCSALALNKADSLRWYCKATQRQDGGLEGAEVSKPICSQLSLKSHSN